MGRIMAFWEVIKMTKILFVDDENKAFERFKKLPFYKNHEGDILHRQSPIGLPSETDKYPDLRLIILDILWGDPGSDNALDLGVDAMKELSKHAPDIPVVIHSIIDNEEILNRLIPEMIRLGAIDWISKLEPRLTRSFRLERIYMQGRDVLKRPASRAILPIEEKSRSLDNAAIMFIDMCGFTALTNEIGNNETLKILVKFYETVGIEITNVGGYIDKYIGDAIMAVFGASAENQDLDLFTHIQHCIKMARLTLAKLNEFRLRHVEPILTRRNLQIKPSQLQEIGLCRVAIESGPVEAVIFERGNESELTFIGRPVNIAARILNEAKPNEIWLGQNAHQNGGKDINISEEREVEYKNFPGTFMMYRVKS